MARRPGKLRRLYSVSLGKVKKSIHDAHSQIVLCGVRSSVGPQGQCQYS